MKIKNKQIAIILVSMAVLFSVVGYVAIGQTTYEIQGYRVLYDQSPPTFSAVSVEPTYKSYSTTIMLPSSDCTIDTTVFSYGFPEGVNGKGDITKDGKIDWLDMYILGKSYGAVSGDSKWDVPFTEEKCFYLLGERRFEDPDRNLTITMDDLNLVRSKYGVTATNPYSMDCDSRDECKADVNKDGKVDLIDIVMVAKRITDPYPDFCFSLSDFKPKDADINGPSSVPDGKVDLRDLIISARSFGSKANQNKITEATVDNLGNKKYKVSATGYNIYHVDLAYTCNVPYSGGGGGGAHPT